MLRFLDYIGDLDIKAIIVSGRTYAQRFSGPNDVETTKAVALRFKGIVLANGGVTSAANGPDTASETGADGPQNARGALGNPWVFQQLKAACCGNGNRQTSP